MHNFSYTPGSNDINYYIFSLDGSVKKSDIIQAPFSTLMHDFFITKDYALFPVNPLTFNIKRAQQGQPVFNVGTRAWFSFGYYAASRKG